jgi:hypothetical protein
MLRLSLATFTLLLAFASTVVTPRDTTLTITCWCAGGSVDRVINVCEVAK